MLKIDPITQFRLVGVPEDITKKQIKRAVRRSGYGRIDKMDFEDNGSISVDVWLRETDLIKVLVARTHLKNNLTASREQIISYNGLRIKPSYKKLMDDDVPKSVENDVIERKMAAIEERLLLIEQKEMERTNTTYERKLKAMEEKLRVIGCVLSLENK
jgi:hypothetical protein